MMNSVPEDECRRLLATNAAELYGADLAQLQEVADRVGPTVEEIATPLQQHEIPQDDINFAYLNKPDGARYPFQSRHNLSHESGTTMSHEPHPDGPAVLQRLGTDEYTPPPHTDQQAEAVGLADEIGAAAIAKLKAAPSRYWAGRKGTAAGLLALTRGRR